MLCFSFLVECGDRNLTYACMYMNVDFLGRKKDEGLYYHSEIDRAFLCFAPLIKGHLRPYMFTATLFVVYVFDDVGHKQFKLNNVE